MSDHASADQAMARGQFGSARIILEELAVNASDDPVVWMKLAAARRGLNDLPGGLQALAEVLRITPLGWMPLLMKGKLLQQLGRDADAAEAYAAALYHCPPEEECSPPVRGQIATARRFNKSYLERTQVELDAVMIEANAALAADELRRVKRYQSNILRQTAAFHQEPTHYRYPELPEIEFFDRETFPFFEVLEAALPIIQSEFQAVLRAEAAELVPYVSYSADKPLMQWTDLNNSRQWTAIHLLRHGERVHANAAHCPRTLSLFEGFDQPLLPGLAPNLMFSLLAPRTRIPPHHGVANTRLVLHLPLVVPRGCGFRVGAQTREWAVGEAFAFDDTIEHEAWNDSDELRVVLIGDLWRPELSRNERVAVQAAMALLSGSDRPNAL